MDHAELIRAIDAHLSRTGESATAFGRRVCGDPHLVADIRSGRSPRLRLIERIMATTSAPSSTGFAETQAPFATEARALGLDPEAIARKAIRDAIKAEKERRWLEENREAIAAHNEWVEKHGVPLAKYRMF